MENNSETLILRVIASYVGAIGYGDVYRCSIFEVLSGDLVEKEIAMTILASDKVNLNFLSTRLDAVKLEMKCKKKYTNEPYSMMPISGFVDKNRTSWEIEYLKEASG